MLKSWLKCIVWKNKSKLKRQKRKGKINGSFVERNVIPKKLPRFKKNLPGDLGLWKTNSWIRDLEEWKNPVKGTENNFNKIIEDNSTNLKNEILMNVKEEYRKANRHE